MNVPKRIFWTTIGTAAIAVATFVTLLFWFSGKADDIAADELHQRVATAIENAIKHNAVLTIDYTHWDSAFFWLQAGVADDLYANLGSGAGDSVSFDLIYLLSPNGTAQYAYVSDNHESDLDNFEPRIANELLAELTKLDFATTDVVSSLIDVDGDIVIATAGRILPDDLSGLSADTIPIMIGGLWLDIPALKDALMIKSLAIMPDLATLEPGQSAYVLKDINGVSIAQLVWERPPPAKSFYIRWPLQRCWLSFF